MNDVIITQADAALLGMMRVGPALKRELERAIVVSSEAVPPDVATMNSQVCYTDETTCVTRTISLIYERAPRGSRTVSVLDPLGSALLGLSVGQEISWKFPDGKHHRVRLEAVIHQPERSCRGAQKPLRGGKPQSGRRTFLLAVAPEAVARFERVLYGHELYRAKNVVEAKQMLKNRTVDLVILGCQFDESRALDLLSHMQGVGRRAAAPILCIIALASRLPSACFAAFENAARALHAVGVEDVRNLAGDENGDRRLRDIVDWYASKARFMRVPNAT